MFNSLHNPYAMIYLNNAGTTWPKPSEVHESIDHFLKDSPEDWSQTVDQCLADVVDFFGIPSSDRFLFTTGCTSALAIALSDFAWKPGDRLLISHMEHHALSRWFYKLQMERQVEGLIIPRDQNGPIDLDYLEKELKTGARMVAISMASNVTGELLPYEDIIKLSHQYGALCLLDGAQVAGLFPIAIASLQPDIFVFAGHKGPMAPKGIGGLYLAETVQMNCPSASCEVSQEGLISNFPTYCDAGSINMIPLAGLQSGLKWLKKQGWPTLTAHRTKLVSQLRNGLEQLPGFEILGHNNMERVTGAVAVKHAHRSIADLEQWLRDKHDIRAVVGFQCAPLAHEALGTTSEGCLRLSVGPMNKEQEIDQLLDAMAQFQ